MCACTTVRLCSWQLFGGLQQSVTTVYRPRSAVQCLKRGTTCKVSPLLTWWLARGHYCVTTNRVQFENSNFIPRAAAIVRAEEEATVLEWTQRSRATLFCSWMERVWFSDLCSLLPVMQTTVSSKLPRPVILVSAQQPLQSAS